MTPILFPPASSFKSNNAINKRFIESNVYNSDTDSSSLHAPCCTMPLKLKWFYLIKI
jgi:hypothetical protein